MYCMNNVHILSFTCVCTVWTGKLILILYPSPLTTAVFYYINNNYMCMQQLRNKAWVSQDAHSHTIMCVMDTTGNV